MNWLLLGGALGVVMAAKNRGGLRQLTFEITTRTALPVGEQVFITGNQDTLGNWQPDGFPLTRVDDNVWLGTALLPNDRPIEFKITRGSWNSEETLADGSAPGNQAVEPGGDRIVTHAISGWMDMGPAPAPQISGNYRIHDAFHSRYLRFDRRVIVWLPPSYEKRPDLRYPVLYMQDGQQVFDPQTSTWNQDWEVDEWCTKLIPEKKMQEVIVVAAYSTEDRFVEYSPSLAGSQYVRFVIDELKPFIDREYRTHPGRESTAVAGSSLGASIAFFMAWTRPEVFFGAACLSPAFRFRNDQMVLELVRHTAQRPDLRIYLYGGLGDPTEQELAEGMYEMAKLLKAAGFARDVNLRTSDDPAGKHTEVSWAQHTDEWLTFLFGK